VILILTLFGGKRIAFAYFCLGFAIEYGLAADHGCHAGTPEINIVKSLDAGLAAGQRDLDWPKREAPPGPCAETKEQATQIIGSHIKVPTSLFERTKGSTFRR